MSDQETKTPMEEQGQQPDQTNEAVEAAVAEPSGDEQPEINKVEFENLQQGNGNAGSGTERMDLILDIMLPVSIELGRTHMYIKDILDLERGSIIELDKMAGEPVDLFVNNKKMAEGEVVVVDKHFGIRITQLINPADRIKNLGKEE